jgi:hypothetical protein
MGSEARPHSQSEDPSLWECLLDWAQDQNAGGGRINWVATGRKLRETSETELVKVAVAKTGADAAAWVLTA